MPSGADRYVVGSPVAFHSNQRPQHEAHREPHQQRRRQHQRRLAPQRIEQDLARQAAPRRPAFRRPGSARCRASCRRTPAGTARRCAPARRDSRRDRSAPAPDRFGARHIRRQRRQVVVAGHEFAIDAGHLVVDAAQRVGLEAVERDIRHVGHHLAVDDGHPLGQRPRGRQQRAVIGEVGGFQRIAVHRHRIDPTSTTSGISSQRSSWPRRLPSARWRTPHRPQRGAARLRSFRRFQQVAEAAQRGDGDAGRPSARSSFLRRRWT